MHKIEVRLASGGYDIIEACGLLARTGELIAGVLKPTRVLIVTNPAVDALYGGKLREALKTLGCDVHTEALPEGEEWKTLETVERLIDKMVEAKLDRGSLVVVLGGGVVGDIAGFAASIYMRGIALVQIPTTLLAQVDSSIGGKTGVDHPRGKNLIGAFYQPALVCIDPEVLSSLPEEQMRNGMAEVIKYGMIADDSLFAHLERSFSQKPELDDAVLEDVIRRCCHIKARVVQQDERETTGLRAILNYGHTIGHAVEAVTGFTRYCHGEAVSIGMIAAAGIAVRMGLLEAEAEERQKALLVACGLPTIIDEGISADAVLDAVLRDKKTVGGRARFVIPLAVGKVVVKEGIPREIIEETLAGMKEA